MNTKFKSLAHQPAASGALLLLLLSFLLPLKTVVQQITWQPTNGFAG